MSVVFCHTVLFTGQAGEAESAMPIVAPIFLLGQYGVAVFIVLSGFVLALPVAGSPGLELRGGLLQFATRRARRILPPYYAALLAFTAIILIVPGLREVSGTQWDNKLPVDTHAVLTHLLLVHNLGGDANRIDGPMWSVATEFQIYFVFALAMIALWRLVGVEAAAAVGLVAGMVLQKVLDLDGAHPWYIGLFGFGMVAASAVKTGRPRLSTRRWTTSGLVLLGAGIFIALFRRSFADEHLWIVEPLIGAGVAASLVSLVEAPASRVRDMLAHRRVVGLGLFSYSIYLIHSPIIGWCNLATHNVDMPIGLRFTMLLLVAVPLAIGISFGFYLLVEKRFLSGHQRAVENTVLSPARQ
jgi:peptidoglycan/LPS O-acetylase OafA/YrhL